MKVGFAVTKSSFLPPLLFLAVGMLRNISLTLAFRLPAPPSLATPRKASTAAATAATPRVHAHASSSASASASASASSSVPRASAEKDEDEDPPSIVEECYAAWNRRDFSSAADCFAPGFSYDDGMFLGTIENDRSLLAERFAESAGLLPEGAVLVVDKIAKACNNNNNKNNQQQQQQQQPSNKIGTEWHAEVNGKPVPRTRGCSFYTLDPSTGLIATGFKVSEMLVKPSKSFSDGLVASAGRFLGTATTTATTDTTSTTTTTGASVIERYFESWNARDMEAALDCFVENCLYETEDPVFVDAFVGREALREHLFRNARALPPACSIVLDDLAVDDVRNTIGVRWHLEGPGGLAIPNLRGCSMYTTVDPCASDNDGDSNDSESESGGGCGRRLKTGYDVTESPVKVPGVAQKVLAAVVPPSVLFGTVFR